MKRLVLLALVATMFAGCVQDKTEDIAIEVGSKKVYASIESSDNRVQLNSQKQTVWNAGDQIIIYEPMAIYTGTFDGETGDRSGSFTLGESHGYVPDALTTPYAVYASDVTDLKLVTWSDGMLGSVITVPATQNYLQDSYGLRSNVMIGTTTDGENYTFKNVLGYLRLSLTGNKSVKSITITSNGGEALAGIIVLRFDDVEYFIHYQNTSSTVTLDCGSGVALSSTPTNFYFAITPTNIASGITAEVTFTDGSTFSQKTSNAIPIVRNGIQPLATFRTDISDSDYQKFIIHHSGSTFVAPLIEGATSGSIDWGDGTTSLLDEFVSYDYTDNASSHIITIKTLNASDVTIPSMKGVTKLDLSNF